MQIEYALHRALQDKLNAERVKTTALQNDNARMRQALTAARYALHLVPAHPTDDENRIDAAIQLIDEVLPPMKPNARV